MKFQRLQKHTKLNFNKGVEFLNFLLVYDIIFVLFLLFLQFLFLNLILLLFSMYFPQSWMIFYCCLYF